MAVASILFFFFFFFKYSLAIVNYFEIFSYYIYIQIYQLDHISSNPLKSVQGMLKKIAGTREKPELLQTQLLLADRMNLNSVKEWCKCGYCSVMPTNREFFCCREIDDIVSKKLSDGIQLYAIHSHA